jgi:hypothetical protein
VMANHGMEQTAHPSARMRHLEREGVPSCPAHPYRCSSRVVSRSRTMNDAVQARDKPKVRGVSRLGGAPSSLLGLDSRSARFLSIAINPDAGGAEYEAER